MQQNPVQGVRDVGVDLLQIGHPVFVGNAQILSPEGVEKGPLFVVEIGHQHVAAAHKKDEDVAQSLHVKAEQGFALLESCSQNQSSG